MHTHNFLTIKSPKAQNWDFSTLSPPSLSTRSGPQVYISLDSFLDVKVIPNQNPNRLYTRLTEVPLLPCTCQIKEDLFFWSVFAASKLVITFVCPLPAHLLPFHLPILVTLPSNYAQELILLTIACLSCYGFSPQLLKKSFLTVSLLLSYFTTVYFKSNS